MADKQEAAELTRQDYNDIWYLVDYYGSKMWPLEKLKSLLLRIKNAENSAAE